MLIDTLIIQYIKESTGKDPGYNLIIYGDGKVVFEGINNVSVKGLREANIESKEIISLISEFKEIDYFSLENNYIDKKSDYTSKAILSLSISKEDDKKITKRVAYNPDDKSLPEGLKKIDKRINDLADVKGWISGKKVTDVKLKDKKDKKPKIKKKVPRKMVLFGSIATVIIIILVGVFAFNIIPVVNDSGNNDNGNGNNGSISKDKPIDITFIATTNYDSSEDCVKPTTRSVFNQGNLVFVYYEYCNVTHDGSYDYIEEITVTGTDYNSNRHFQGDDSNTDKFCNICIINTSSPNVWDSGEYQIVFNLSDSISNKCSVKSINFTLVGTETPIVSISASPDSGDSPLEVSFKCIVDYAPYVLSFQWDFDESDGLQIESTDQNTSHTFTEAGNYIVTLTVFDDHGFNERYNVTISVLEQQNGHPPVYPLEASITIFGSLEGSPPLEITFYGSATGGTPSYSYEWDFDYDYSSFDVDSTEQNPTHTFTSMKVYTVMLRVTDENGEIDTEDEFVYCYY
jgi:PKD repeat protein